MLYLMKLDQPALIYLLGDQYKILVELLYRYFDILLDIPNSFLFLYSCYPFQNLTYSITFKSLL